MFNSFYLVVPVAAVGLTVIVGFYFLYVRKSGQESAQQDPLSR